MSNKMRLRWNNKASSLSLCWETLVCVSLCSTERFMCSGLFCTQTSILRFFNETRKNNHKTNIKHSCCCCCIYLSFIAEKLHFHQFNTLTPFPIIVSIILLNFLFIAISVRDLHVVANTYIRLLLNWLFTLYTILACVVREESLVDWFLMFCQRSVNANSNLTRRLESLIIGLARLCNFWTCDCMRKVFKLMSILFMTWWSLVFSLHFLPFFMGWTFAVRLGSLLPKKRS